MITTLQPSDIHIDFTGNHFSETDVIKKGYQPLTGKELQALISNKIIEGDYPLGYTFITRIYENGITEGINNVGTQDVGNWSIDFKKNTLQLIWKNSWLNTVTRAYKINEHIVFYDVNSGNWRTTFKKFTNLLD